MSSIVLGPMLRYADGGRATVWLETDTPCTVEVQLSGGGGGAVARERTFSVHGHHYALVVLEGLAPGRTYQYTVLADGEPVWGAGQLGGGGRGSGGTGGLPESRIRTLEPDRPVRLVLGSCRASVGDTEAARRTHGVDALRAYARRLARTPPGDWPDALLLLGDQVYADETSPQMRRLIRARRPTGEPPGTEVADFAEYALLYRTAWSDPFVRWLLATVPTAMVFDDHDIRDDWNTSDVWRAQMARTPWWQRRVVGGLAAYWLYQHLGNLSPEELASDAVLAEMRRCSARGEDGGEALDAFAAEADAEPGRYRWSYVRDFGRVRLLMVDSRCGRVLERDRRLIVDEGEWAWLERQAMASPAGGAPGHLLVGTSLPYLLPPGIHHVEAWNEAVCAGAWGRAFTRVGETLRQGLDLEHWASFTRSFAAMTQLLTRVVTRPDPPASVVLLSGDVHYSYLANAALTGAPPGAPPVAQVVCSPIRNPLGRLLRSANRVAQLGAVGVFGRWLAGAARVSEPGVRWAVSCGPWFVNSLATVTLADGSARVCWEGAADGAEEQLRVLAEVPLAPPVGRAGVRGRRGRRLRARWPAGEGRSALRGGSARPSRRPWPRRRAAPRQRHGDGA